jgi:hypothetical protein
MGNETFYSTAATIVPILLFAMMAARNLVPGQLSVQRFSTVLLFGLPIVGALAAFAFLYFQPVPKWAEALLASVTWLALISQFLFGAWWIGELVKPASAAQASDGQQLAAPTKKAQTKKAAASKKAGVKMCPACGALTVAEGADLCAQCLVKLD